MTSFETPSRQSRVVDPLPEPRADAARLERRGGCSQARAVLACDEMDPRTSGSKCCTTIRHPTRACTAAVDFRFRGLQYFASEQHHQRHALGRRPGRAVRLGIAVGQPARWRRRWSREAGISSAASTWRRHVRNDDQRRRTGGREVPSDARPRRSRAWGAIRVMFSNVDDQLRLWVDGLTRQIRRSDQGTENDTATAFDSTQAAGSRSQRRRLDAGLHRREVGGGRE